MPSWMLWRLDWRNPGAHLCWSFGEHLVCTERNWVKRDDCEEVCRANWGAISQRDWGVSEPLRVEFGDGEFGGGGADSGVADDGGAEAECEICGGRARDCDWDGERGKWGSVCFSGKNQCKCERIDGRRRRTKGERKGRRVGDDCPAGGGGRRFVVRDSEEIASRTRFLRSKKL
ncbi:unnamed protein product [Citrullus colocynthis]|uniref:Uncharacterized protein n=1 Tax=Citrullus colocynthis TaxID=252529 RepID=A0ABP0Y7M5_9ROSI